MSKSIWQKPISVEILTQSHVDTVVQLIGVEFLEVGDDFIRARVPFDKRTRQPRGILHGGVSVVLAETLGSCGAAYSSPPDVGAVGLEINANHIRAVNSGWVTGVARPFHTGRTTHVWSIELRDDQNRITCISRITMALLPKKAA